jgi:hypothetical protein
MEDNPSHPCSCPSSYCKTTRCLLVASPYPSILAALKTNSRTSGRSGCSSLLRGMVERRRRGIRSPGAKAKLDVQYDVKCHFLYLAFPINLGLLPTPGKPYTWICFVYGGLPFLVCCFRAYVLFLEPSKHGSQAHERRGKEASSSCDELRTPS